jgi:hypothetical protein
MCLELVVRATIVAAQSLRDGVARDEGGCGAFMQAVLPAFYTVSICMRSLY